MLISNASMDMWEILQRGITLFLNSPIQNESVSFSKSTVMDSRKATIIIKMDMKGKMAGTKNLVYRFSNVTYPREMTIVVVAQA